MSMVNLVTLGFVVSVHLPTLAFVVSVADFLDFIPITECDIM